VGLSVIEPGMPERHAAVLPTASMIGGFSFIAAAAATLVEQTTLSLAGVTEQIGGRNIWHLTDIP
jgi:hypothetical protein